MPKNRNQSRVAERRREEKYERIDDRCHPHNLNVPIKKLTEKLREVAKTKNYVKIMTELDECKYIVQQHYIYCDDDIWVCGDALVMNQNPDKAILTKCLCTSTRDECIAHHKGSTQYVSVCPKCRHIQLGIVGTDFECEECKALFNYQDSDNFPVVCNLPCAYCPALLGWEEVNKNVDIRNLIVSLLELRQQTFDKYLNHEIESIFKMLGLKDRRNAR